MQIQLTQPELEEAIQTYLKSIITIPATKKFTCEFQATRGANGITTTISIVDLLPPNSVVKVEEIKEEDPIKDSKVSMNFEGVELTPVKETKRKTFFADL